MTTLTLSADRCTEISSAVQQVYNQAGLDLAALKPGVVPLDQLIRSYPIRREEIRDLTYQSAAEFLIAATGQRLPMPRKEGKLAGFLYVYEFAGVPYGFILVEKEPKNARIERRRFSAAHELGHYVLHFLLVRKQRAGEIASSKPLILTEGLSSKDDAEEEDSPVGELMLTDHIEARSPFSASNLEQMELEADQFAAEILMPVQACWNLAQQHRRRRADIQRQALARRLAPEFLVSQTAMERRLTSLDLPASLQMDSVLSKK